MEQFSALKMFVSVVDAGGFSAAGDVLGVSTSVVSRQIAALEAELGVSLLKRSTRRFELTEAGSGYLHKIRSLLTELEATNRALRNPNSSAAGRFRIAAPSTLGQALIGPAVAGFMAAQPGVTVHVDLLDRSVDADEEDYDLVLWEQDSEDEAAPILARIELGLYASPAYCAVHNRPHGPADLPAHQGLFLTGEPVWKLRGSGGFQPKPHARANRLEVLTSFCRAGQGIALIPNFLVRGEIERGELIQLLDGFEPKPKALISAIPSQKRQREVVKLFVSYLEARFKRSRF